VWNDGALLGIPTTGDDVFANGFTVNMDTNATVNSLNNSARARDIATPAMTANNAPSPYVAAASTINSATRDAYRAFDRSITDASGWLSANNNSTGWISMDFGSGNATIIDGYTVYGNSTQNINPRNWSLQGSDNNTTWTDLHIVSGAAAIPAGGSYSIASIGNSTAYRYYRLNITLNGGATNVAFNELELYQPGTAALASGGSFNFNTAGVTVSATSTSAALSAGATNLITVTATTGTVTLSLGSAVTSSLSSNTQIFSYTGACNFTLNGVRYTAGSSSNSFCINKSSTGIITITGDLIGGGANLAPALNSTAGNTIVIGNVSGTAGGLGIVQSAGNITVTGNVTGGTGASVHGISLTGAASQFTINGDVRGGSGGSAHGINFGGTLGTVNGNVTGGGGLDARGVSTGTGGVNVTGNVIGNVGTALIIAANSTIIGNLFAGGVAAAIGNGASNNSFTVTVTGDVYASTTQSGIVLIGTGTQVVNLTGNMYNTLGRMAIWCPNVFISNTATTLWRMDTGGGNYKFLYSADSTPNLPATTDVRFGTTFGPALSLTGTMVTVSAANTRKDVPTDNTVGTGELTSADIISGINASSDPIAVRLKNTLTDTTAGNIISQYNNS
jgi:hypothetical protein